MKPKPLFVSLALLALATAAMPVHSQERAQALDAEPKLDKPVTVRWSKTSLYDALTELSKATGVTLAPERSRVDEPIMASASQLPARELLKQIAELNHYSWIRNGGTKDRPSFLLVQTKRGQEEELRELLEGRLELIEALKQELARYRSYTRMAPDDLKKVLDRADSQFGAMMMSAMAGGGGAGANMNQGQAMRSFQDSMSVRTASSPLGGALLELIDGLSIQQWNYLIEAEEPVVFSTSPKSGELRMPDFIAQKMKSSKPQMPFPKSLFASFGPQASEGINKAEQMMQEKWSQATGMEVSISVTLGFTGAPIGMLRATPNPQGVEGELGPLFSLSGLNLMAAPKLFTEPEEDPMVREKRLNADPVLGKKATLKLPELPKAPSPVGGAIAFVNQSGHPLSVVWPAVEEAYGVRLLGDAYSRQSIGRYREAGKEPEALWKVLDRLAAEGKRWVLDGQVIRFRSKTWASDRRSEIPLRLMARWQEMHKRQGSFSLENLAEMATSLRDEQTETLMYAAMELEAKNPLDYMAVGANREILRFYGKLLPQQRKALLAGQPLPVRALFPYQRVMLVGLNRGQNKSPMAFAFGSKRSRTPDELMVAQVTMVKNDLGGGPNTSVQPSPTGGVRVQVNVKVPQEAAPPSPTPAPARPMPSAANSPRPQGAAAPAGGTGVSAPGMGQIAGFYTFQVQFPNGQKDEYRLILNSTPGG